jgi:hypothetical protein
MQSYYIFAGFCKHYDQLSDSKKASNFLQAQGLLDYHRISTMDHSLFLHCLTLDDKPMLSRNVGNTYRLTLRNVSEQRRCHLHLGGNLNSQIHNFIQNCFSTHT